MFSKQVYINRRFKLTQSLRKGTILFFGNQYLPANYPSNTFSFRQDSCFLYYIGIDLPDLAVLINCETNEAVLFGHEADADEIVWTGKLPSLRELGESTGISQAENIEKLPEFIQKVAKKQQIHFFVPYQDGLKYYLSSLLNKDINDLKKAESAELIRAIVSQRILKEELEIEEMIETMNEITVPMYASITQLIRPGVSEREIMGCMEGIALEKGNGMAFLPIISIHGDVLHNPFFNNQLAEGQLLLVDAGAQSLNYYATDITRTYPISGKFTKKQKDIYEIVLKAQKEAIAMAGPNILYKNVHLHVAGIMAEGLKSVGLMKGNTDDIVACGAHTLFFPHGLGHMLGLDVHDMENLGEDYIGYDQEVKRDTSFGISYLRFARRLQENYIVTVEPGIYFIPELFAKWKKIKLHKDFINYDKIEPYMGFGGIRIEDDIIITSNGSKVLGKGIPKEIEEIEDMLSAN